MRKYIDRDPLAGAIPEQLVRYPACTPLGNRLRQIDASRLLKEMDDAEQAITQQQSVVAAISSERDRFHAQHELNIEYLIVFGVCIDERHAFQGLLHNVVQDGSLTLKEAARLTHLRQERDGTRHRVTDAGGLLVGSDFLRRSS